MATSMNCGLCRTGDPGARMKARLILGLFAYSIVPIMAADSSKPDFGPNVMVFNPSMTAATMQEQIDKVYATQRNNQFGPARNALLFAPGEYKVDVPIGYYTQVLGLGPSPDSVHISGNVHSDATLPRNNATCTFWKAAEGFSVTPTGGADEVGRFTSRTVPPHARSWRYCPSPGRRMGERRLDVGRPDRRQGGRRPATAVDFKEHRVGKLDRRELEHGLRRRSQPAGRRMARAALHQNRQVPIVREKPFLEVDKSGKYSRPRSCAADQQLGHHLARRVHARKVDSHRANSTLPGRTRTPPRPSMRSWPRARTCCSLPASTN